MRSGCHNCIRATERTQEGDKLTIYCPLTDRKIVVGTVITDINKVIFNNEICDKHENKP